jgi:hypothetical protein
MSTKDHEALARKRVKAKKDFYSHLATYLTMAVFFFLLNALTAPGRWWFYWPMLGWGIGLASHYLSVFGLPGNGAGGSEWEVKELAKERERLGIPAADRRDDSAEYIDEHLELRELEEDLKTSRTPEYRREDLV